MPDRVAPIIPYETIYQGDFLLPIKNDKLLSSPRVIWDIKISKPKYPNRIKKINNGDNI